MNIEDIVDVFYNVLKDCIENIVLPTGKTLLPSLKYSVLILIASIVSSIFGFFTFISWTGASLGVLCLVGLCIIERREDNEVSRLYRDTKLRVRHLKERATKSDSSEQVVGTGDGSSVCEQEDGTGVGDSF